MGCRPWRAANATSLSGLPWDYDAAADLTGAVANSDTPSIAGNIGQFMNPYLKQVVGATSADLDASDGRVRAQQALDLAGSGAFGGSGAALTQSATEGELARARATTLGNLRAQGYAQALGGATSQAQLQQQQQTQRLAAAGQLAGIAGNYDANQRANIASQTATGDDLRNVAQQQAQAAGDEHGPDRGHAERTAHKPVHRADEHRLRQHRGEGPEHQHHRLSLTLRIALMGGGLDEMALRSPGDAGTLSRPWSNG